MAHHNDSHSSALLIVLDDLISELNAASETRGAEMLRTARADIAAGDVHGIQRVFDGVDAIMDIEQPASITGLRYYVWKHAFSLYQAERKS